MRLDALDLHSFISRASRAPNEPRRLLRAAQNLIGGALRIRTGNNGLYPVNAPHAATKPAEALNAWIKTLEVDAAREDFSRHNEAQEALIAAAEEVEQAARWAPKASRFRHALYADALGAIEVAPKKPKVNPWLIVGILGGVLSGVLLGLALFRKR